MKVLVLGASGFIGRPIARAFVQAGHIVWGQTRSQETADLDFAPTEILPVVCDPRASPDTWAAVAKNVDVVVDALNAAGPDAALGIFNAFVKAVSDRPKGSPRPSFLYCSGHYVMARGDGGLDQWSDERQPADAPVNKGTIWRNQIESAVLGSDKVNGIVVRPTCLYGTSGSYFAEYHFKAALAAGEKGSEFETICGPSGKISTIHQDDLASLFVRVAEVAPVARGQVFVASNPSTDNIRDILDAVVRLSGAKGYKIREPADAYEKAWITPLLNKPTLGHALTGWAPKRMGLSDGMDVYWNSFVQTHTNSTRSKL